MRRHAKAWGELEPGQVTTNLEGKAMVRHAAKKPGPPPVQVMRAPGIPATEENTPAPAFDPLPSVTDEAEEVEQDAPKERHTAKG